MNLLRTQNKDQFLIGFKNLVSSERKITAEVLEYVKEADRRKLYLDFGYTSLFAFLTKELGYAAASAQRRIEAARILRDLPEIKSDLESGELNLTQVSMVAQNIKAAKKLVREEKSAETRVDGRLSSDGMDRERLDSLSSSAIDSNKMKKDLLEAVKGQDSKTAQRTLAQKLNIPVQIYEKTRVQQDESVRVEMCLSKKQMELLERVKELISHTDPNPKISDVFEKIAQFYIDRKDPMAKRSSKVKSNSAEKASSITKEISQSSLLSRQDFDQKLTRHNFRSEVTGRQVLNKLQKPVKNLMLGPLPISLRGVVELKKNRDHIPSKIKQRIFKRDQICQWKDQKTQRLCGSRFQLQLDHIHSVSKGGKSESENLQLLCAVHNRRKYELMG